MCYANGAAAHMHACSMAHTLSGSPIICLANTKNLSKNLPLDSSSTTNAEVWTGRPPPRHQSSTLRPPPQQIPTSAPAHPPDFAVGLISHQHRAVGKAHDALQAAREQGAVAWPVPPPGRAADAGQRAQRACRWGRQMDGEGEIMFTLDALMREGCSCQLLCLKCQAGAPSSAPFGNLHALVLRPHHQARGF